MEARLSEHQDISAAKETYAGFLTLFKWGAIASAIATAIVLLILYSHS